MYLCTKKCDDVRKVLRYVQILVSDSNRSHPSLLKEQVRATLRNPFAVFIMYRTCPQSLPHLPANGKGMEAEFGIEPFKLKAVSAIVTLRLKWIILSLLDFFGFIVSYRMLAYLGGGYIKLIGVPFRKLYDENEALAELKAHRQNATDLVGWEALLQVCSSILLTINYLTLQ